MFILTESVLYLGFSSFCVHLLFLASQRLPLFNPFQKINLRFVAEVGERLITHSAEWKGAVGVTASQTDSSDDLLLPSTYLLYQS